jgi:hypothetical protein
MCKYHVDFLFNRDENENEYIDNDELERSFLDSILKSTLNNIKSTWYLHILILLQSIK